jgi:hypothetical protein
MIFTSSGFLSESDEVRAGNVVVVSDLASPHPREERLGGIRMGLEFFVFQAVCVFVVDPVHREPGM